MRAMCQNDNVYQPSVVKFVRAFFVYIEFRKKSFSRRRHTMSKLKKIDI